MKVQACPTNLNTNWLNNRGVWVFYVGLILVSWLIISGWTDPGLAWTWVHVIHGLISYYLLHWTKGSPIQSDQGKWDRQVYRLLACLVGCAGRARVPPLAR